jgi:hypothetical protein
VPPRRSHIRAAGSLAPESGSLATLDDNRARFDSAARIFDLAHEGVRKASNVLGRSRRPSAADLLPILQVSAANSIINVGERNAFAAQRAELEKPRATDAKPEVWAVGMDAVHYPCRTLKNDETRVPTPGPALSGAIQERDMLFE